MSTRLTIWAPATQIAQAIDDLRAVADHIETNGWLQYAYADHTGRCCAAGAMNKLCTDDPWSFDSRSAIAFGVFYRISGEDIATFNDAIGRTKQQVLDKLRKVADEAQAQLVRETTEFLP